MTKGRENDGDREDQPRRRLHTVRQPEPDLELPDPGVLPPGPERDISLARQHYLEAYVLLQRIDPQWGAWLESRARKMAEHALSHMTRHE